MRFTARAFRKRLSRKRKQRRQRTRRLYKGKHRYQKGGATMPATNPSIEVLKEDGAVITNPEKVEEYGPDEVVYKAT